MKKEMAEFMDEAVHEVRKRLESGYEAVWNVYDKNNGVSKAGMTISDKVHTVPPCIYMDSYYMSYREDILPNLPVHAMGK